MEQSFLSRLTQLKESGMENSDIYHKLLEEYPNLTYECVRSRVRRYSPTARSMPEISTQTTDVPKCVAENVNIDKPQTTSIEYRKDGTLVFEKVICLAEGDDITPRNILKAHGMDPNKWEVITYKNNLWQSQKKGGEILNLYQSKITAKPFEEQISIEELKEHFDSFKNNHVVEPDEYPQDEDRNLLYEINICDLHLGRFCYDNETGEPLSTEITKKRYFEVIKSECKRIESFGNRIDKILFVWTNDFFNSDGISKATTGGTPQDTDKKWQELYEIGIEMLVQTIEKLVQYAPVVTFYIASNHSRQTDFYAIHYLNAWFRCYKNVDVWINSSPRQYFVYGQNLLGFAHGYYEKKDTLPFLMSNECAAEWSNTKYREFHLAHFHSEKVEEKGGIVFRWLPSVTSADTWSKDCGYVTAIKRSYSFVYDFDKGLIQMNSTIVE